MGFLTKSRSNIWTTLESYFRKIGRKCAFWPPKYWPRYGEKAALGRRERERERTLQYVSSRHKPNHTKQSRLDLLKGRSRKCHKHGGRGLP